MRGPDAIGMVIGERYALRELLGGGGLSYVYLAHDQELDREVVIKSVHDQDERSRALLMREARLLSSLGERSRGMVAYLDLVLDRGELYLVTEHIRGEPLSDWQARSHMPREIMALYEQIARVLAEVHAAGAVHRDLKPSNVMVVDGEGGPRAVLIDFGLAVSTQEEDTLTGVGTFMGTLAYINPEVAQGFEATPASDVFSLGCMLVEALTGHLPWSVSAGALAAYLQAVLTSPPDLSGLGYDALRKLLRAMLDKEPARRPAADQVAAELAANRVEAEQAAAQDIPLPESWAVMRSVMMQQASSDHVRLPFEPRPTTAVPGMRRRLGGWLTGDGAAAWTLRLVLAVALVAGLGFLLVRYAGHGWRLSWTALSWALVPLASALLLGLGLLRRRRERRAAAAAAARGPAPIPTGLDVRLHMIEERLARMGNISDSIALEIGQIRPQLDQDRLEKLVRESVLIALAETQVGADAGDVGKAIKALADLAPDEGPTPWHRRMSTWLTVGGLFLGLAGGVLGLISSAGVWKPNAPPVIRAITTDKERATRAAPMELRVDATDPEGEALTYTYAASIGQVTSEGPLALWKPDAASTAELVRIDVVVSDGKERARQSRTLRINRRPALAIAAPAAAAPGDTIGLSVHGEPEPDGDRLVYEWRASRGRLGDAASSRTELTAPVEAGMVRVHCTVSDGWERWELDSAAIEIQ